MPAPRHYATRPSDTRPCSGCNQPARVLRYHPFERKYLCPACYDRGQRHPTLHGPLSSAAVHHIARCPQCAVHVRVTVR